jgi:hypothetical protein
MEVSRRVKVKGERLKVTCLRVCCLVSCFLVLGSSEGKAQTFAEWFEQGKTLTKYLGTQIAYLEAYDKGLIAGYKEAKSDLGLIRNFKDGEMGLHTAYYSSLVQVSPSVKTNVDLTTIDGEVQVIHTQFEGLGSLSGLTGAEADYIAGVEQRVLSGCDRDMDELAAVLTPNTLSMTDAERIKKLREISSSVKEAFVFACGFCGQVRILAAQRVKDGQEAFRLDKLYGGN